MSREFSWNEWGDSVVEHHLRGMFTALPGVIVTVRDNLDNMAVDVQPVINYMTEDGESVERPVILNVPINFPTSRSAGMTFPVATGDPVLLVFSMRGMDTWKRGNGESVDPTDSRKFDIRDCFAIPGVFPFSLSPNNPSKHSLAHNTNDTVMYAGLGTANETEVRLTASGSITINAPSVSTINTSSAIVNADSTTINAATNTINGDVQVNGKLAVTDLLSYGNGLSGVDGINGTYISGSLRVTGDFETEDGYTLRGHKHSGVQGGDDNTGTAVP